MNVIDLPAQEAYDRWAPTYDRPNPLVHLDGAVLSRRLDAVGTDLRGVRVLDLGCGTGRTSRALCRLGADVTAVDFSKGMLDVGLGKTDAGEIRFLTHDLTRPLPFPDASYDVIVSTLVLEHIERLLPVFQEMRRVCSALGWIYISDIHPVMRMRGGQAQFSDRASGDEVRPHGHGHKMSEYVMSILGAGLRIAEMDEHIGTEALAAQFPKYEHHIGWPMLLTFVLEPA